MKDNDKKFSVPHPKFSKCKHCGKQIQSNSYMNSHMKIWHPEISYDPIVVQKSRKITIEGD